MNSAEVVRVKLTAAHDRSYDIVIQPNILSRLGESFSDAPQTHAVIITDQVVAEYYLSEAVKSLQSSVRRLDTVVVPAGEAAKSIACCTDLWERFLALHVDRKSSVIALGGGVIGDLAGFVAATFARGLEFIQIPSTLLAQVDSSVGGKVGVNLAGAKNMVGAFWQPSRVLIDPNLLITLDNRNFLAGMAEVIKYGVIMDRSLFDYIEQHIQPIRQRDPSVMTNLIATCCRCKARIVESDERETSGQRAILNYGHTLGHAIESVFGYGTWLHGEAVAMGMTFAARLACELGLFSDAEWQRQLALLQAFDLPTAIPPGREAELLAAMNRDKKVAAGKLNLILPRELGRVEVLPAPSEATMVAIMQQLASLQ